MTDKKIHNSEMLPDEALLLKLGEHRRFLLGTSLVTGAVGLLPVPLLPDVAISALRRALLSRIARERGVTLGHGNARRVVGEETSPFARWMAAAGTAAVGRSALRRLSRSVLLVLRFEEMGRTFMLGTYFEVYLLRYHRGQTISEEQAELVGRAAAEAYAGAHVDLLAALFRHGAGNLWRVGTAVPATLLRMAGALLSGDGSDAELAEETEVGPGAGLVRRAVGWMEQELATTARVGVQSLVHGFDQAWTEVGGQGQVMDRGDTPGRA